MEHINEEELLDAIGKVITVLLTNANSYINMNFMFLDKPGRISMEKEKANYNILQAIIEYNSYITQITVSLSTDNAIKKVYDTFMFLTENDDSSIIEKKLSTLGLTKTNDRTQHNGKHMEIYKVNGIDSIIVLRELDIADIEFVLKWKSYSYVFNVNDPSTFINACTHTIKSINKYITKQQSKIAGYKEDECKLATLANIIESNIDKSDKKVKVN